VSNTARELRSLIITSSSTDELGHASTFLRGQQFSRQARVLLPPDLYAAQHTTLPFPASPYAGPADILAAIETHQPDVVCFFSAYLLSLDGCLSTKDVDTVIRALRARDCSIITSDPFLGLASELTSREFDTRMLIPGGRPWKRRLLALLVRLRGSKARIIRLPELSGVVHVYPTSAPERNDGIARMTFFNPVPSTSLPPDHPPRWLFLLSSTDLHVQQTLVGLREFLEGLLGALRQSVAAGRPGTLIAPAAIAERLAGVVPPGVELLQSCPVADMERRVLEAEYVFSWDPFSFSQLSRIASELPVFFLDRGHLSHAFTTFYEVARSCHLGGWEPTYVDQRQLFSPYVLAHLAKMQKPALRVLREQWERSPTANTLANQIVSR
jgi:hypothetical protein